MDQKPDQSPSTPKQQVVERLKQAANVLVTVKSNPNVDELAAAIGLTLMLNKLDKHTTAVFSGEVPSTLEFLKPDETIETNTDSLRDFIVSLDKSKADKLRYKVEENVVKIYITPYRTSISEQDLEFTQGDFNVDAVVALGVTQREELDQAITMHGRILHDATVITVTAGQDVSELGQINWQEPAASSLSEMLVSVSEAFQGGLIDEQIATAFLTGIVSETERFSNTKTSPKVMTIAAQLMAAGANQQLIANELEKAIEVDVQAPSEQPSELQEETPDAVAGSDGTLSIKHEPAPAEDQPVAPAPEQTETEQSSPAPDEQPALAPSEKETSSFLPSQPPAPEQPDSFNPLMGALTSEPNQDQASETDAPSPEPAQESTPEPPEEPDAPAEPPVELPQPLPEPVMPEVPAPSLEPETPAAEDDGQIHIDHEGNMIRKAAASPKHKVIQPLSDTASAEPEQPEVPQPEASDDHGEAAPEQQSVLPPPPELDLTPSGPIPDNTTLEQLEKSVNSPHLEQQAPEAGLDSARNAVEDALGQASFDAPPAPRAD